MPDQHPQDQPAPKPQQEWHEVSAQEIEQTLSSAADLAHELAGDVGVTPDQPRFRDSSGLESIESTLDVELKQLEHLVSRTKEELSEGPPRDREVRAASIPDFMSEFLADEPVALTPQPAESYERPRAQMDLQSEGVSTDEFQERSAKATEVAKAGLIGVGSLGRREAKKTKEAANSTPQLPTTSLPRATLKSALEKPVYAACKGAVRMLELMNWPFARLSLTSRQGLSVTAIAAFCACLLTFLWAVLFSR